LYSSLPRSAAPFAHRRAYLTVFHLARGGFGLEIIRWNYIANIEAFRGLSTSTDPFH